MSTIIAVLRNYLNLERLWGLCQFGAVSLAMCTLFSFFIGPRYTYRYLRTIKVKMEVDTALQTFLKSLKLSLKGGTCLCGAICTVILGFLLCQDVMAYDHSRTALVSLLVEMVPVAAVGKMLVTGWLRSLHDQGELIEDILERYSLRPTEVPALETKSEGPSDAVSLKKPARDEEWALRKSCGEWEKFLPGYPELGSCSIPPTPNFDSLEIIP